MTPLLQRGYKSCSPVAASRATSSGRMSTRGPPKLTPKTDHLRSPQHCSAQCKYLAVRAGRQNKQPVPALGTAKLGNNVHVLVVALARTVLNVDIPEDMYK